MKTRNNYSKLRSQKNSLQHRLNIANTTVCLQINEIKRYSNALLLEQKANRILENRINTEVEEKLFAFNKLADTTKEKNDYYDWCIEEINKKNRTENKLIIGLTISMFVITALVAILIKGL